MIDMDTTAATICQAEICTCRALVAVIARPLSRMRSVSLIDRAYSMDVRRERKEERGTGSLLKRDATWRSRGASWRDDGRIAQLVEDAPED